MPSLISGNNPGYMCVNQRNETPLVNIVIEDMTHLRRYGIVAHTFSITETENVAITPSIGDNLFVYCTNSAPVQIFIKGVIGHISYGAFPRFYENDRVGKEGKILKVLVDGTAYRAVLTSYSREYTSSPSPVDNCSITLLAVRV